MVPSLLVLVELVVFVFTNELFTCNQRVEGGVEAMTKATRRPTQCSVSYTDVLTAQCASIQFESHLYRN